MTQRILSEEEERTLVEALVLTGRAEMTICTNDEIAAIKASARAEGMREAAGINQDLARKYHGVGQEEWATVLCDGADAILSAIGRSEVSEWKPIETAPKDGEFLAERQTTGDWLKVVRYHGLRQHEGEVHVVHQGSGLLWSPRRWMPLPSPPEARSD